MEDDYLRNQGAPKVFPNLEKPYKTFVKSMVVVEMLVFPLENHMFVLPVLQENQGRNESGCRSWGAIGVVMLAC